MERDFLLPCVLGALRFKLQRESVTTKSCLSFTYTVPFDATKNHIERTSFDVPQPSPWIRSLSFINDSQGKLSITLFFSSSLYSIISTALSLYLISFTALFFSFSLLNKLKCSVFLCVYLLNKLEYSVVFSFSLSIE